MITVSKQITQASHAQLNMSMWQRPGISSWWRKSKRILRSMVYLRTSHVYDPGENVICGDKLSGGGLHSVMRKDLKMSRMKSELVSAVREETVYVLQLNDSRTSLHTTRRNEVLICWSFLSHLLLHSKHWSSVCLVHLLLLFASIAVYLFAGLQ